jgi:hypothetical protein
LVTGEIQTFKIKPASAKIQRNNFFTGKFLEASPARSIQSIDEFKGIRNSFAILATRK